MESLHASSTAESASTCDGDAEQLEEDLFAIRWRGRRLFYAPLRGALFSGNEPALTRARELLAGGAGGGDDASLGRHLARIARLPRVTPALEPFATRTLEHATIILTNACNFSCSYCYARAAHDGRALDPAHARRLVDHVLERAPIGGEVQLGFIGGGEPTLAWPQLVEAVEHAERGAAARKITLVVKLVTNGSAIDDARATWLRAHGVRVSVSFEVLPDAQDGQRPLRRGGGSFAVVDATLRRLCEHRVPTGVRATITAANVDRLVEMIELLAARWPAIRYARVEPALAAGEDLVALYRRFTPSFLAARRVGRRLGVAVHCAVSKNLARQRARFCRGELCLVPGGDVVSCHRVTARSDPAFARFRYGRVDDRAIALDAAAFDAIARGRSADDPRCAACFARWHCAGNCACVREALDPASNARLCAELRRLHAGLLAERAGLVGEEA